jgi:hypothetical protein
MVRTTGFVEHECIRYSMPPRTIGMPATLFLYPEKVRIVTRDGTEAEHPRRPAVGHTSYRSEDRVAKLAAVHGERASLRRVFCCCGVCDDGRALWARRIARSAITACAALKAGRARSAGGRSGAWWSGGQCGGESRFRQPC